MVKKGFYLTEKTSLTKKKKIEALNYQEPVTLVTRNLGLFRMM